MGLARLLSTHSSLPRPSEPFPPLVTLHSPLPLELPNRLLLRIQSFNEDFRVTATGQDGSRKQNECFPLGALLLGSRRETSCSPSAEARSGSQPPQMRFLLDSLVPGLPGYLAACAPRPHILLSSPRRGPRAPAHSVVDLEPQLPTLLTPAQGSGLQPRPSCGLMSKNRNPDPSSPMRPATPSLELP